MSAKKPRGWVMSWTIDWDAMSATHTTGLVVRKIGSRLSIDVETLEKAQADIEAREGAEHLPAKVRRLVDQAGRLLENWPRSVQVFQPETSAGISDKPNMAPPKRIGRQLPTDIPVALIPGPPVRDPLPTHIPVGLHIPDEEAS